MTGSQRSGEAREDGVMVIGSWNMSAWTPQAAEEAMQLGADVIALQETKLATVPLHRAQSVMAGQGWKLHHGIAVMERAGSIVGASCGTGFLVAPGRALTSLDPTAGAWRRLHAMGRIHVVRIPDADGSGHLRVVSVYAPLKMGEEKEQFAEIMAEMLSEWDMQEPTLLVGDFNGSVNPQEDYGAGVVVCVRC
jgi:endonuclease/exonuclease/phosphatase family metal-dependent hydrolase